MKAEVAVSEATQSEEEGEGVSASVNEVRLVGRVAAAADTREMPSGDTLVSLRVVVARPPAKVRRGAEGERPRALVDAIDVACWSALTRRAALRAVPGQVVEVTGALRRRFYRAGAGAVSRYEVEATSVRRRR